MKIISINLPEKYLSAIQTLVDFGVYPSRSEAIRNSLKNFLPRELIFDETLGSNTLKNLLKKNKS